jgi:hypothetical protein
METKKLVYDQLEAEFNNLKARKAQLVSERLDMRFGVAGHGIVAPITACSIASIVFRRWRRAADRPGATLRPDVSFRKQNPLRTFHEASCAICAPCATGVSVRWHGYRR